MPLCSIQVKTVVNQSINNGQSATFDLDVSGWSNLTVYFQLQNTTTTADGTQIARIFAPDGTVAPINLPNIRIVNFTSDGTHINSFAQYDVRGISKLRVGITNNNVAAKTAVVNVYLGA